MSRLLPVTRPNKIFVQSQTFHILNSYKKIFLLLKRNSVDNLVGSNQQLVAPRQRPKSFSSSCRKLRSFAAVLSLLYVHCASSPTQRIVSNDLCYVKGVFHMCRKIWSDHFIINIATANAKHMFEERRFVHVSR